MRKNVLCLFACLGVLACNDKPQPAPGRGVNLVIYPNPTASGATIAVLNTSGRPYAEPYTLLVFDPEGQELLRQRFVSGDQRYNLPLLNAPKGNYQVIVDAPTGVTRKKLVKL